jgi:thiol-disulfide isomerase/thioredoxin
MRLLLFCLFIVKNLSAQTIHGFFPELRGTKVRFGLFEGLESRYVDSAIVQQQGTFSFTFSTEKPGVGYLLGIDERPFFLILDEDEKIELAGTSLGSPESIQVLSGPQNLVFAAFASSHKKRQQALIAWQYLSSLYSKDQFFAKEKSTRQQITRVIRAIHKTEDKFLNRLPPNLYVSWYLPVRRMVSDAIVVAQSRPEEIPAYIAAFRALDYADERLYRSGLLKDAIDRHFWLLENSGFALEVMNDEMKKSIDLLLWSLWKDQTKLQQISAYLFETLERQSLFEVAEYLALRMLQQDHCTLPANLAHQFEGYRAMKKGRIAPEIYLAHGLYRLGQKTEEPEKLSQIHADYILVIFGANWCPRCKDEMPKLLEVYPFWKNLGIELLFMSLEEREIGFESQVQTHPFFTFCDFKSWQGKAVLDYHVYGTPSYFLLDKNRKILLRPSSIAQMEAWVNWFLVQGNALDE